MWITKRNLGHRANVLQDQELIVTGYKYYFTAE